MEKLSFSDLEVGQMYKYNHLYWIKVNELMGSSISDDSYNNGTSEYFPSGGENVRFGGYLIVVPIDELNYVSPHSQKIMGEFGYTFEELSADRFRIVDYPFKMVG